VFVRFVHNSELKCHCCSSTYAVYRL